ncbi:hypothetical protein C8F01DRAFT_1126133 [Mycena amicta]|nr:hypothetical protein C8F01DRAFT_1126133 [Mycena amicta]
MPMRYSFTKRDIILILVGAVVVHVFPSFHPARQQIVVETVCESPSMQQPLEKLVYRTTTATTTTTVISQPPPTPVSAPLDFISQLPQTVVLGHAPGWTLFKDVYVSNGTFFIVSDRPPHGLSATPLEAFNTPENIAARMPTKNTLDIITSAEALRRWGGDVKQGQKNRVLTVAGNTVLVNEPGQFLNHFYHLVAELFFGVQAMLHSAVTPPSTDNSRDFTAIPTHDIATPASSPIDRVIFAHTDANGWRDRPDFNSYFLRAVFPGASIEEQEDWEDHVIMTAAGDRVWHFPQLLLTDRSASHRGDICGVCNQRIAAEAFVEMRKQGKLVGLWAGGWWAPVREAVLRFAGVPAIEDPAGVALRSARDDALPTPSKISHISLVALLKELVARKGATWELNIVEAENLSKDEQLRHAARTTIMLGVHGNGLTHLVMMRPNRLSTVIELFYPGGFAHDYQWPTHALGMRHFAIWNDTWHTDGIGEGKPGVAYPEGFQGEHIPVHGPTVAQLIEDRVGGR